MENKCHFIAGAFILIAVSFFSCTYGDEKIARKLFKERNYLIKIFKDKTIINRNNTYYQFSCHVGQSVNVFNFQKKGDTLIFIDDSLQFPISDIITFSSLNNEDSLSYVKALSDEFRKLLNAMETYKIDNVSAEFMPLGIDMKIYFGDYKALLYINNVGGVKNDEWKKYIKTGEKFDDNWYYVKDEP